MGAPVDVCKGTCICVCVREKGEPMSVHESGKRVGEGQGDIDPGGNRLGWPLSSHLLCLISDSIWGWGVLKPLSDASYQLPSARAI